MNKSLTKVAGLCIMLALSPMASAGSDGDGFLHGFFSQLNDDRDRRNGTYRQRDRLSDIEARQRLIIRQNEEIKTHQLNESLGVYDGGWGQYENRRRY